MGRGVAQVPRQVSVEKLIIKALKALYGSTYEISSILSDTPDRPAIRVQRIGGAAANIQIDRPLVEVDVITSKHISGENGYGVADDLSLQVQADLSNMRSLPGANGVVQFSKTIAGPRRIPDLNEDTFRFAATYELSIHP
jgi:hypothetical protein